MNGVQFINGYRPVTTMRNRKQIAGPKIIEQSGQHLSIENTYNDKPMTFKILGDTVEIGEGDKSPDNPYELRSVGDDGGFDLVSTGENLLDSPGTVSADVQSPFFSDLIPVGGKLDVVFQYVQVGDEAGSKRAIKIYDKNKDEIRTGGIEGRPSPDVHTFYDTHYGGGWQSYGGYSAGFQRLRVPAREDIYYVQLVLCPVQGSPYTITYTDIKAEIGLEPTPYTPFRGMQTIHIPYTLRGQGDVRDTVEYVGNGIWRYIQRRFVEALDGTEPISLRNTKPHTICFRKEAAQRLVSHTATCTHLPYQGGLDWVNNGDTVGIGVVGTEAYNSIFVKVSAQEYPDVDTFKAWLSAQHAAGTPVTAEYELAEPADPIYFTTEELRTFYPYTQIYTTSDIQPTLEGKFRVMGGQDE